MRSLAKTQEVDIEEIKSIEAKLRIVSVSTFVDLPIFDLFIPMFTLSSSVNDGKLFLTVETETKKYKRKVGFAKMTSVDSFMSSLNDNFGIGIEEEIIREGNTINKHWSSKIR